MDSFTAALYLLLASGLVLLIWTIKRFLLRPKIGGDNIDIKIVLNVSGRAEALENTIYGLEWLRDMGFLRQDILIADIGMDSRARRSAELLSRHSDYISLIKSEQISNYIAWRYTDGGTEQLHTDMRNGQSGSVPK